jgi:hypothetical protein
MKRSSVTRFCWWGGEEKNASVEKTSNIVFRWLYWLFTRNKQAH